MTIRRVSMMAAAVSFVWTLPLQEASAQSVVGAGTVPIIKIGQGVGAGAPQGNFTAAAHSVHGIPVGAARVRFPGFAVATVEVDCLHVDGNRAVVGGPIGPVVRFSRPLPTSTSSLRTMALLFEEGEWTGRSLLLPISICATSRMYYCSFSTSSIRSP